MSKTLPQIAKFRPTPDKFECCHEKSTAE